MLFLGQLCLCGCWQVAAARAAKKRTHQTGYIIGTIENETGIEDPLGRERKAISITSPQSLADD